MALVMVSMGFFSVALLLSWFLSGFPLLLVLYLFLLSVMAPALVFLFDKALVILFLLLLLISLSILAMALVLVFLSIFAMALVLVSIISLASVLDPVFGLLDLIGFSFFKLLLSRLLSDFPLSNILYFFLLSAMSLALAFFFC